VNFQAILPESLFKCAQSNRSPWLMNRNKGRRPGGQTLNFAKIFRFIGRDLNQAPRNERTSERGEKAFRYNSARGMAPLRPRIGKHEIKCLHRFCGQHPANRIGNFATQNARVIYAAEFDFAASASHSSGHPLNPKEVSRRIRSSCCDEK